MPRFFVAEESVRGDRLEIRGADAEHLARSLRVRVGERLTAVEANTCEHVVEVDAVSPSVVTGRILETRPPTGEPRMQVHVLQAIPARGMDQTVEALSVAGAAAIRPVLTERSVARPDRATARLDRWRTIAREAAQLAGRAQPPVVEPVDTLDDAVAALTGDCRILACVVSETAAPLHEIRIERSHPVALVVGPEGGLGRADLALLEDRGATQVHLGPRVAPTRLAGFLAVSLLLAHDGDLDTSAQRRWAAE
ncbi:MAG: 16S rRNA (uracil(1498)-N(3))-methyltransferase [Candidatus Dormibacteria bacterium]